MSRQKIYNKVIAIVLSFVLTLLSITTGNTLVKAENPVDKSNLYVGNGFTVEYEIISQWEGAYVGKVTITNTSKETIEDWKLNFVSKDQITNIWDAKIIKYENNLYQISNTGYNQDISVGKTVSFGFNANFTSKVIIPTEYTMPGLLQDVSKDIYDVQYAISSKWDTGYIMEITVKNLSQKVIEDWVLNFDLYNEITNIWNGKIISHGNGNYIIQNCGYNSNISVGGSVSFGFQVSLEDSSNELNPENILLQQMSDDYSHISDGNMDKPFGDLEDLEWNMKMINVNTESVAKAINTVNGQVKIALIDSGVDYSDVVNVVERKNFIPDEEDMSIFFEDGSGHGTCVAEIIAANPDAVDDDYLDEEEEEEAEAKAAEELEAAINNDGEISLMDLIDAGGEIDIRGINPNVQLYSAKVLDENNEAPVSRIIEGINWAIEKEVNIISISFGTTTNSTALHNVIKKAYNKGILMIAAVGNGSRVEYPAAYDEVIGVGAVDNYGKVSQKSATGKEVDLVAPGELILSRGAFGGCEVFSGTSMAVPHVVGLASVLWQQDLSRPSEFIKQLLFLTANHFDDETKCGYGLIDFDYALKMYQEYNEIYDSKRTTKEAIEQVQKEGLIPENDSKIEVFDDVTYVDGSWGDDHGKFAGQLGTKYGEVVDILKKGASLQDIKSSGLSGMTAHPEFHGYYTANYISSTFYLMEIARRMKGNKELLDKKEDGKIYPYDGMKEAFDDNVCMNNLKWSTILKKKTNTPTNRSLVIYGMAIHTATDLYAHSSYRYTDKAVKPDDIANTFVWRRILHDDLDKNGENDADDSSLKDDNRDNYAKAVAYNLLKRIKFDKDKSGQYVFSGYTTPSINDFCIDKYRNINSELAWDKKMLKMNFLDKSVAIYKIYDYAEAYVKSYNKSLTTTQKSRLKRVDLEQIQCTTNQYQVISGEVKGLNAEQKKNIEIKLEDGKNTVIDTIKDFKYSFAIKQGTDFVIQPYINGEKVTNYKSTIDFAINEDKLICDEVKTVKGEIKTNYKALAVMCSYQKQNINVSK